MKPETRRDRALFAARLHVKSNTMLSDEAVREVCAELLATRDEADAVATENEQLRVRLDVKSRPVTIEQGKNCIHGVPLALKGACGACAALTKPEIKGRK